MDKELINQVCELADSSEFIFGAEVLRFDKAGILEAITLITNDNREKVINEALNGLTTGFYCTSPDSISYNETIKAVSEALSTEQSE